MNPREYRRQVEAGLRRGPETASSPAGPARETARDWSADLARLADPEADAEARRAALGRLQAGTFLVTQFAPYLAAYVDALRAATASEDADLRRAALDILASRGDDYARRKLVEGLRGTGQPLVPPAVALGLLARDDHGPATEIARDVLTGGADVATRAQAARVLAADPGSKDLLSGLARDKGEAREVRRASVVALRSLDSSAFSEVAREVLADEHDYPDIKATLRGALQRDGVAPPAAPAEP